jgi:hypothetical protein
VNSGRRFESSRILDKSQEVYIVMAACPFTNVSDSISAIDNETMETSKPEGGPSRTPSSLGEPLR